MPVKLSTTVKNIALIPNPTNASLLCEFYEYMSEKSLSEKYQNGNLKVLVYFARFLGPQTEFYDISKKEQIIAFLNTRIRIL
jgi:integrase/recombinase XerD